MSLNPPLDFNGSPLRVEHEYFVLKRTDMKYSLSFENSTIKYQGTGSAILTTCRMIIVNSNRVDTLKAYELPLSMIINEKYCQPLLGTNYIMGDCFPMFGNNFGKVNFTLTFIHPCGTFVTGLFLLLDSLRAHDNKSHDKEITNAIRNNTFNLVFPVDKNDPSDFIYDQPDEIPAFKPLSQSVVQNDGNVMRGFLNEAGMSVISQNDFGSNMNQNNNNGFEYKHPQQYEYKSVQYNNRDVNPQPNNNNPQRWVNPYLPQKIIEHNNNKVFPIIQENEYEENKKEIDQIPQMSIIPQQQPHYYQSPMQIHPPQIHPPQIFAPQLNPPYQNQPQYNQYDPYPSFDDNKYNPPQFNQNFNLCNRKKDFKDPLLGNNNNFSDPYSN